MQHTGHMNARTRGQPLLVVCRLLVGVASVCLSCSNDAAPLTGPGDATQVAPDVLANCPVLQRRGVGSGQTCCPAGHIYDFAGDRCVAVGPPECAATVLTAAEQCEVQWCEAWRESADHACDPSAQGCSAQAVACPASAVQARAPSLGDGVFRCPAGRWWSPATASCEPAGVTAGALASLPSSATPPALADTAFCVDPVTGHAALCAQDVKPPCGPGRMPSLPSAATCIDVGANWLCPPGFVAHGAPVAGATMAACRPDPAACPADPFGGIPTKQGTLFVDASAPAGGDGSRPKPLRTIGAAIAKATVGATIAVAKGVYPEPVVIPFALNLRGRCAALVVIKPPLDNLGVRVEGAATSARVVVSGVTIADTRIGISAPSALPSRFERVWVHDADLVGAYVRTAGGDVELVDVVIADTAGSKFNTGAGVLVTSGAKASLERVRLHRNTVTGVAAENVGSMITLRHVRVDDTRPGAPIGRFGFGLSVMAGGRIVAQSVRLSGNHYTGAFVSDKGSTFAATALVIDATRPQQFANDRGIGLQLQLSGTAVLEGARMAANHSAGIALLGVGATVQGHGVLVDGTLPSVVDNTSGAGVLVQAGGHIELDASRLTANRTAGAQVDGVGSRMVARRLLVDGTRAASDALGGAGVNVTAGASLELTGARLLDNRSYGLAIAGEQGVAVVKDVAIVGTRSTPAQDVLGYGVVAAQGAQLTITASTLTANAAAGIVAGHKGTRLHARGVLVEGTRGRASDGFWGTGVMVQTGAELLLSGSALVGNRLAGMTIGAANATKVRASGVRIDDTLTEAGSEQFGSGVLVAGVGDDVVLRSCLLRRNHTAAITLSDAGATIDSCVAVDTRAALYHALGDTGRADSSLADGLVADGSAAITVSRSVFAGQKRAGLLLNGVASATLAGNVATGSAFGLVRQTSTTHIPDANAWFGNGQDVVDEAGLFAPPAPELVTF